MSPSPSMGMGVSSPVEASSSSVEGYSVSSSSPLVSSSLPVLPVNQINDKSVSTRIISTTLRYRDEPPVVPEAVGTGAPEEADTEAPMPAPAPVLAEEFPPDEPVLIAPPATSPELSAPQYRVRRPVSIWSSL